MPMTHLVALRKLAPVNTPRATVAPRVKHPAQTELFSLPAILSRRPTQAKPALSWPAHLQLGSFVLSARPP